MHAEKASGFGLVVRILVDDLLAETSRGIVHLLHGACERRSCEREAFFCSLSGTVHTYVAEV